MRWWGILSVAALVGGAVVAPGQAAAETKSSVYIDARTADPDGNRIHLTGFRNRVSINAGGRNQGFGYDVAGTVRRSRIAGDFADFAQVDLTFEPRGKPRRREPPGGCRGAFVTQRGTFQGTFALRVGDGPTMAVSSLRGSVSTDRVRCPRPPRPPRNIGPSGTPGRAYKVTELFVSNSSGRYGTTLWAEHRDGSRSVRVQAHTSRRIGAVSAFAYAAGRFPAHVFAYDLRKDTASLQPGPPFTGRADLGAGEYGVPAWTGDLALSLPSFGVVPLTGPQFQASLSRGTVFTVGVRSPRVRLPASRVR